MGLTARFKPQTVAGRKAQSGFFSTLARFKALGGRQKAGLGAGVALVVLGAPIIASGLSGQSSDQPSLDNYMNSQKEDKKTADDQSQSQTSKSESGQSEAQSEDGQNSDGSSSSSASNSSNLNVHVESSSVSSSSDDDPETDHSGTNLEINGQQVSVPASGTLHKRIKSSDGSTNLNISVKNSNSAKQTGGASN